MKYLGFMCIAIVAAANAQMLISQNVDFGSLYHFASVAIATIFNHKVEEPVNPLREQHVDIINHAVNTFRDFAQVGGPGQLAKASSLLGLLKEHRDKITIPDDPNSILSTIIKTVKEKIQHCEIIYENDNEPLNVAVKVSAEQYADPIAKQFNIIVDGVKQLKQLLEREGYMQDIQDAHNNRGKRSLMMQQDVKEFWVMKLLESKACLKILCGMMTVEWNLLFQVFLENMH